ncbi:MAG: lipoprotein [Candidatus Sedimenticola sp. (ex Thyasira tokunagai)]
MQHRYSTLSLLAAILLGTILLTACGQKGDLYLPDESGEQQEKKKS